MEVIYAQNVTPLQMRLRASVRADNRQRLSRRLRPSSVAPTHQ